jgi:putative DNA primase/helicase
MVRRDRGRYVAAALTIVRAYIVAGKPDRLRPLPSYEPWSDLVRSSLVWLGRSDPVATMEETQKDHAAVVHGLTRFVGHLLDMTRSARRY